MRPWPPPLPQDLPLRSPHILLRRDPNLDPELDPDLDLVLDGPEAAVPLDLFLMLPLGDLDLDPDLVLDLDLNIFLNIDPPPPPIFLSLLDVNHRRWGERDPLFIVEVVVVVAANEKAILLSLALTALLFLKDYGSDIDFWWRDCKLD